MITAELFKCLADEQRVRILNLLSEGPLCVCHLQEILAAEQVKMSKQLGYMKRCGLLEANREGNWMIYSLGEPVSPLLHANLDCLREERLLPVLHDDLRARGRLLERVRRECCGSPSAVLAAIS